MADRPSQPPDERPAAETPEDEKEHADAPDEGGRLIYRTLDEQEGRLTDAEKRFERNRRTVGLFLGPLVLLAMLAFSFDLAPEQQRLLAILAFVVVWWITEAIPIPVTALLGVVLCVVLQAVPPPEGDDSAAASSSACLPTTTSSFSSARSSSPRRWWCDRGHHL